MSDPAVSLDAWWPVMDEDPHVVIRVARVRHQQSRVRSAAP
jgi:hypothetical protein